MKEKDPEELSWTLRCILVSISFFAFSWFTKLIKGSAADSALFAKIGFIALGLAIICFAGSVTAAYLARDKKDISPAPRRKNSLS